MPYFCARNARLGALLLGIGGLGLGCGGRAEGEPLAEETPEEALEDVPVPTTIPPRGGPSHLGDAEGSIVPSQAPGIAPSAVPTFCYEPDSLERNPDLQALLPLLPEDAFDSVGCLTSDYSGWLVPGRCVYDPSGAELTRGRCCYRMEGVLPDCP